MRERMFFFKKLSKLWFNKRRVWSMFFTFFKKKQHRTAQTLVVERKKKQAYGKVSCILYFIINFICHMSTDIKSRTVENPKYTEHAKLSDDSI